MVRRRERPRCRKVLERLLAERGCTLQDLLEKPHRLSDGLRIQARKMVAEEQAHLLMLEAQYQAIEKSQTFRAIDEFANL